MLHMFLPLLMFRVDTQGGFGEGAATTARTDSRQRQRGGEGIGMADGSTDRGCLRLELNRKTPAVVNCVLCSRSYHTSATSATTHTSQRRTSPLPAAYGSNGTKKKRMELYIITPSALNSET